MKKIFVAGITSLLLTACTSNYDSPGLEPIPGSITYGGQPRTKLTKSPIGSTFQNELDDQYGRRAVETYQIQPDRSLKIVNRQTKDIDIFGADN